MKAGLADAQAGFIDRCHLSRSPLPPAAASPPPQLAVRHCCDCGGPRGRGLSEQLAWASASTSASSGSASVCSLGSPSARTRASRRSGAWPRLVSGLQRRVLAARAAQLATSGAGGGGPGLPSRHACLDGCGIRRSAGSAIGCRASSGAISAALRAAARALARDGHPGGRRGAAPSSGSGPPASSGAASARRASGLDGILALRLPPRRAACGPPPRRRRRRRRSPARPRRSASRSAALSRLFLFVLDLFLARSSSTSSTMGAPGVPRVERTRAQALDGHPRAFEGLVDHDLDGTP